MFSSWKSASHLIRRAPSAPHPFATSGFTILNNSQPIEEELFDHYSTSYFYPVRIGEILNSKYQVIGKLGYGSNSTVWLCRDLFAHKYVTIKVGNAKSSAKELDAYKFLASIKSKHAGQLLVRRLDNSFNLNHHGSKFLGLVHEPLSVSLEQLRNLCPGGKLPVPLLKALLIHIFLALDFLHSKAHMVHADLQEKNIILGLEEDYVLKEYEEEEIKNPSPRKIDGDRIIHESKDINMPKKHGRPIITDLGEARYGQSEYTDCIQPFQYRAPEVILGIPWSYSVDIWNVGVLIWDVFERKLMFRARDKNDQPSTAHHLAQMVALIGPPPVDLIQRSAIAHEYFESDGNWKGLADIPLISLEMLEENLGNGEKAEFLKFIRKMIQWKAEDRSTAVDLLNEAWLHS